MAEWEKEQEQRNAKAEEQYVKIREANDVPAIAKATKMPEGDIQQVKEHVFFKEHQLYDGYGRFPADYDIAVAWKRLATGQPEERDILLMRHELLESQQEMRYNLSASEAHAIAKKVYDWEAALQDLFGEGGEPNGLL